MTYQFFIGLAVGAWIGATIGAFIMAAFVAMKKADEDQERRDRPHG